MPQDLQKSANLGVLNTPRIQLSEFLMSRCLAQTTHFSVW